MIGEKNMTAVIDGNEYKCKDCKWFSGREKHTRAECMNPKKQRRFADLDSRRSSLNGMPAKARYKYPSYPACKKFEAKNESTMDSV